MYKYGQYIQVSTSGTNIPMEEPLLKICILRLLEELYVEHGRCASIHWKRLQSKYSNEERNLICIIWKRGQQSQSYKDFLLFVIASTRILTIDTAGRANC